MTRNGIAVIAVVVLLVGAGAFLLATRDGGEAGQDSDVARDGAAPAAPGETRLVLQGRDAQAKVGAGPSGEPREGKDGEVKRATLSIDVRDLAGRPIARARAETGRDPPEVGVTDAAGHTDLPIAGVDEEIGLEVSARGYVTVAPRVEIEKDELLPIVVALAPGSPVSGRVVDAETGTGIEGAKVGVTWSRPNPWAVEHEMRGTTTAADGAFEWPGAPDDTSVTLTASHEGRLEAVLEVHPGAPRTELRIALVRGARVTGTIRGIDGKRAATAAVWLAERPADLDWRPQWRSMLEDATQAVTDDAGRFAFENVAFSTRKQVVANDGEFGWGASAPLVLSAESPSVDVDVRLSPRGTLFVKGQDTSGAELGTRATLVAPNPMLGEPGIDASWTDTPYWKDKEGPARFDGVLPGSWRVEVRIDGFVPVAQDVVVRANEVTEVTVQGKLGPVLTGDVADARGAPVSGAQVSWQTWGDRDGAMEQEGKTRSDDEGRFRLENLQAVKGNVEVWARGQRATVQDIVPGGAPVHVVLEDKRRVVGRLVFPEGTPTPRHVDDLEVEDWDGGGSMGSSGMSLDAEGRFEWVVDQATDAWLCLFPEGFAAVVAGPLKLTSGQQLDLGDLRVEAGYSRSGRVVDPRGNPIAGAQVKAHLARLSGWGEDGTEVESAATRPDGTFTFHRLPTRTPLRARAKKDGRIPGKVEFSGPGPALAITLAQGSNLKGRVTSSSGKRANYVHLNPVPAPPVDEDDDAELGADVGIDGTFEIGPIAPGTYRAEIHGIEPDRTVDPDPVTLAEGETREVEWRVP